MKTIRITGNKITYKPLVMLDDADYEFFKNRYLNLIKSRSNYYVVFVYNGKLSYLHKFLLNPPKGLQVDHIDRNTMNNQRSNLRVCTPSQNSANWVMPRKNGLPKGVHMVYTGRKKTGNIFYQARIMKEGVRKSLGWYKTPQEAMKVYQKKAIKLFGEFARFE